MRLKLSRFRRNFNKDLPIEFTEQNLSSFGGLELFSRYLRRVELSRRVGKACRGKGIRSDYGSVRLVLVLVGMLLVGARRLEHLQYVCDDPMLLRFCGLRRLPSRPTIVNWLKQFTGERLKGLSELNGVLVHEQIERLGLNRLTVDMDGTVVQAGNQVGWAFRGFNPHRKKNKSYYPLFAHLAQTGQILKSRNRPGNVHDSKGADAFLRELIGELRGQFGRSRKLEFRTDAAFFNEKILKRLERSRSEFAIKAPFWPWLGLKEVVAGRKRWHRVSDEIDARRLLHQTLHRALEYHRPDRDLSEASSTSNGEELPARPVFSRRRLLQFVAIRSAFRPLTRTRRPALLMMRKRMVRMVCSRWVHVRFREMPFVSAMVSS